MNLQEMRGSGSRRNINTCNNTKDIEKIKLIEELRQIIFSHDVEKLVQFRNNNPHISLFDSYTTTHYISTYEKISGLRAILIDQLHRDNGTISPNILGKEFIDKLFELGYLNTDDIFVVCDMICSIGTYDKWDDVYDMLIHIDIEASKSYYNYNVFVDRKQRRASYNLANFFFYGSFSLTYFGRIHHKAERVFRLIFSRGIKPYKRDSTDFVDEYSDLDNVWDFDAALDSIMKAFPDTNFDTDIDKPYYDSLARNYDEFIQRF